MKDLLDIVYKFVVENRVPMHEFYAALEEHLILRALDDTAEDIQRAGRLIGVKRTTMHEKMRKYSIKTKISVERAAKRCPHCRRGPT